MCCNNKQPLLPENPRSRGWLLIFKTISNSLLSPQSNSADVRIPGILPGLWFRLRCGRSSGIPIPLLHSFQIPVLSRCFSAVRGISPRDVSRSRQQRGILQPVPGSLLPRLFLQSLRTYRSTRSFHLLRLPLGLPWCRRCLRAL